MALLRRHADDRLLPVPSRCTLGRNDECSIRSMEPFASGRHARISWSGSRWELRDLGSRNGTFVDGERIQPATPFALSSGQRIGLGGAEPGWTLEDDAAPAAMALDETSGSYRIARGDLLALPDEDDPRISVFLDTRKGQWLCESAEEGIRPIRDMEVVAIGGTPWRLHLPVPSEGTPYLELAASLDRIRLVLNVSRDEERVQPIIELHGQKTPLEVREHAYLLLVLARCRLEDEQLPPDRRGWRTVDELCRMLRTDPNTLNVMVHRARRQLEEAGVEGAVGIVEVARGARRIGLERLSIGVLDD